MERKLKTIHHICGQIRVLTGLHIGAGNDTIEIGGMDNPIIRDPRTDLPYIPGSSIKGKMRSLMEWRLIPEKIGREYRGHKVGDHCTCGKPDCPACTVFGAPATNKRAGTPEFDNAVNRGPTRIIVRDARVSEDDAEAYRAGRRPLVEAKNENSINRITAGANPRPVERVVPDTLFDFDMSYRVYDEDGDGGAKDERLLDEVVREGLRQLELDYLGGGGSRGNGRIRFEKLTIDGAPWPLWKGDGAAEEAT